MRYQKLALVLLGCATLLVAADPFVGTWKMNPAKTKYSAGAPPKQYTVAMTEAGADLDVNITGTAADGAPIASHYTMPAKGGKGKIIASPFEGVDGKRINPTQREINYSKGGKVVYTAKTKISADGKTLTANVKGTDATGKAVEGVVIFEKQ